MCRLDIAFVILAVANELTQTHDCKDIILSPKEIIEYGGKLETKTGQAVLNGFSPETLLQYLNQHSLFMQLYLKDSDGYPLYRIDASQLRTGNRMCFLTSLFDRLDPQLNHPMDVIKASGIIPILETED